MLGVFSDDDNGNGAGAVYAFDLSPAGAASLQTTTIAYEYDSLGRLTQATYSGDIAANYAYVYDAVGNMTAYTETVGTSSNIVTRTFDAANQLQAAYGGPGIYNKTRFDYDSNGNLSSDITHPIR